MPVIDLTSKDLWTTLSQMLDVESEHVCVLPMTTFIKPVRSITVLQTDTRVSVTGSRCPPGSKNLHRKPAAEPEQPADTTPDSEQPEPETESPETEQAPDLPQIVLKSEIDSLVTDRSYLDELRNIYSRDHLELHNSAKGARYRNILTFPVYSRSWRPDILVQIDLETGEMVHHTQARGRSFEQPQDASFDSVKLVDGMLVEFVVRKGEPTVIDIVDTVRDADKPSITSYATAQLFIWDPKKISGELQTLSNTGPLQLHPERPSVLYKDTLTFTVEGPGNAILAQIDTVTNELRVYRQSSAPSYPTIKLLGDTKVAFTDNDGGQEIVDVATFAPSLVPANEVRELIQDWIVPDELKAIYGQYSKPVFELDYAVRQENILTLGMGWQRANIFVQLNTETSELIAHRPSIPPSYLSVEKDPSGPTMYVFRSHSTSHVLDVANFHAPSIVSGSGLGVALGDMSLRRLGLAYAGTPRTGKDHSAVLYKDTLTTIFRLYSTSVLVQFKVGSDELLAQRPNQMHNNFKGIEHKGGTTFDFIDNGGQRETVDVVEFTSQGEPLPTPPARIQSLAGWNKFVKDWSFKDELKDFYKKDQQPSSVSSWGYLYKNKFIGLMKWRDNSNAIFVQFDYETGEYLDHKQGSAPKYNSTSTSSLSSVVKFRDTRNSIEDVIDILDLSR